MPFQSESMSPLPISTGTNVIGDALVGQFNTALPTVANGAYVAPQTDANGRLIVSTIANAIPVQGQAIGYSQSAYGTATAPAAGAAVATLAAPGAGNYKISAFPSYGGTADVADNVQLQVGATVIGRLKMTAAANAQAVFQAFDRINVPAGQAITVNAIAAGAAGSVYTASIIVTPVA